MVVTLRTDNGGEYILHEFRDYLLKEGIKHEFTVPRSPEQNGVAERLNRTFIEAVRSMLAGAKLPHQFWAEALATAVYLRNRSPTKAISGLTPVEGWTGSKPSVNHLKAFGCVAYAHISKEERRKLDPKAKRYILLGYGMYVKGYRLYHPQEKKVFYSRDVVFDEKHYGLMSEQEVMTEDKRNLIDIELSCEDDSSENDIVDNEETTEPTESVTNEESNGSTLRRSNRDRRQTDFYGIWVNTTATVDHYQEPSSFNEASQSSERGKWMEAMKQEMT